MTPARISGGLILLLLIAATSAWVYLRFPTTPMHFDVVSAYGEVLVDGQPVGADAGRMLAEGTRISIGADGLASIRLEDGSLVQISSQSELSMGRARRDRSGKRYDTQLVLDRGEILRRVPSGDDITRNAELSTPTSNLGVRGTEFIVVQDGGGTALSVTRGKVAVGDTAGAETNLGENYGVRVSSAGLGVPEVLPAPPELLEPSRGHQLRSLPLEFRWAPVDGASAYLLEVAADAEFSALMQRVATAKSSLELPLLQYDAPLYWRVATRNANGLLGRSAEARVLHYRANFYAIEAVGHDRQAAAQAEPRVAAALRGYPTDVPALKAAAWNQYLLGKHAEARAYYDRALTVDATDLEARIERARVAYFQGDAETAESDYRAVLEVQPEDIDANWGLADVLRAKGEYPEALRRLDAVLEHSPDHADSRRVRARLLQDMSASETPPDES